MVRRARLSMRSLPGEASCDRLAWSWWPTGTCWSRVGTAARYAGMAQRQQAVFTVSLQAPFPTPVTVDYATANGTATAGSDFTATQGTITFAPGVSVKTIVVPVIDDTTTEPTETFTFNLSNSVGGTIADGQAVVTIQDNDPFTKFYVVNDGSPDRTYEYQATGAAVENYALNTGNTAPRGGQYGDGYQGVGGRRQQEGLCLQHQRRVARIVDRRRPAVHGAARGDCHQRQRCLARRQQGGQGVSLHQCRRPDSRAPRMPPAASASTAAT